MGAPHRDPVMRAIHRAKRARVECSVMVNGWNVIYKVRKTAGKQHGDFYAIAPDGKRLRTLHDVSRRLLLTPPQPTVVVVKPRAPPAPNAHDTTVATPRGPAQRKRAPKHTPPAKPAAKPAKRPLPKPNRKEAKRDAPCADPAKSTVPEVLAEMDLLMLILECNIDHTRTLALTCSELFITILACDRPSMSLVPKKVRAIPAQTMGELAGFSTRLWKRVCVGTPGLAWTTVPESKHAVSDLHLYDALRDNGMPAAPKTGHVYEVGAVIASAPSHHTVKSAGFFFRPSIGGRKLTFVGSVSRSSWYQTYASSMCKCCKSPSVHDLGVDIVMGKNVNLRFCDRCLTNLSTRGSSQAKTVKTLNQFSFDGFKNIVRYYAAMNDPLA